MEQWIASELEKEYTKAANFYTAYLNYMQSTSSKIPDWMNHSLESRLPGEISITSEMQRIPSLRQKAKRN